MMNQTVQPLTVQPVPQEMNHHHQPQHHHPQVQTYDQTTDGLFTPAPTPMDIHTGEGVQVVQHQHLPPPQQLEPPPPPQPEQYIPAHTIINNVAHIKASSHFPQTVMWELQQRMMMGQGGDAVWRCKNAKFVVHKFILALNSKLFQRALGSGMDDIECDISTPDFDRTVVRSLICLFYTGSVSGKSKEKSEEIHNALSFLECNVADLITEAQVGEIKSYEELIPELDEKDKTKSIFSGGSLRYKIVPKKEEMVEVKLEVVDSEPDNDPDPEEIEEIEPSPPPRRGPRGPRKHRERRAVVEEVEPKEEKIPRKRYIRPRSPSPDEYPDENINVQRHNWITEALFGKVTPGCVPCYVCYEAFADENDLMEHMNNKHAGLENTLENGPHYYQGTDLFCCPVCKREVRRNSRSTFYFIYHLKRCMGKKCFPVFRKCKKCYKKFKKYRSFMAHLRDNCEQKEHLCHICSMALRSRQHMLRHVKYVHSDARPFMCGRCPKRFKRKADLGIHEQTHETALSWSCEHCGKAFNQKRGLRTHIRTHMNYMDKPHQCSFCSMRFVRKQYLDNHLSTHLDYKRYGCEICGVRVKTKDALRSHRKKVHKIMGPLPAAHAVEQAQQPPHPANSVTPNSSVKEESMDALHFMLDRTKAAYGHH